MLGKIMDVKEFDSVRRERQNKVMVDSKGTMYTNRNWLKTASIMVQGTHRGSALCKVRNAFNARR